MVKYKITQECVAPSTPGGWVEAFELSGKQGCGIAHTAEDPALERPRVRVRLDPGTTEQVEESTVRTT